MIDSDHTYIDRFAIHELNRNVDMAWVSQMKIEIMKTVMAEECMTLTLAIDKRQIETAMNEPDGHDQGGFKAIILDGQHRWEAMRHLKEEVPGLSFNIWLIVYIVNNDAEILHRLETLNKRRAFSQADNDKIAVTQQFLEAFERLHTPSNQTRRCVVKVRKSRILKSDTFIAKHRTTTVEDFIARMIDISLQYKELWHSYEEKTRKSVLNDVIRNTKLYQLADDTCNWLKEL